MKKVIFIVLFGLISTQAYALPGTTKGGYVACTTEKLLDDIVSFVTAKDKDSFEAYVNANKCIILKKGLNVTVTDSPGVFGSKAGFVFKGIKLWAQREALDYGN